jgi:hypothetical protein
VEATLAVKKGVKKQEHELLSDANIAKVIGLLEAEKPITKKEAYELLNIKPNPTRLANIIGEYLEKVENEKKRRAENRGKPASDFEVTDIVASYLAGDGIKEIADRLYRSADFVKKLIDRVGVPSAGTGEDYWNFTPLPEQCVAEEFEDGEFVWSSRHGRVAEIIRENGTSSNGIPCKVYQIFVYERIDWDKVEARYACTPTGNFGGRYANIRAYDLGSLKHLKPFVSDFKRIIK